MGSLQLERHMMPCCHGRLPHYLQECEYIESTGVEYIMSGIECPNTYVDATFQFKSDTAMPSIGIGTWNYAHRFQVVRANTDGFTYDIGAYQNLSHQETFDTERHRVQFYASDDHSVKFDGRIRGGSYDNIDLTSQSEIYLFSSHGTNGSEYKAKMRLYSCKMIKNGTDIVREFIPCYVKATGEAGLYDLVSKTFFNNANSSGAFLHGGDI